MGPYEVYLFYLIMSFLFGMGYWWYYPGTTTFLQTRLIEGTPTVFAQGHSSKELVLLAFCLMTRQLSHLSAKPVKPISWNASKASSAGTSAMGFWSSTKLEGQMGSRSYSSWQNWLNVGIRMRYMLEWCWPLPLVQPPAMSRRHSSKDRHGTPVREWFGQLRKKCFQSKACQSSSPRLRRYPI